MFLFCTAKVKCLRTMVYGVLALSVIICNRSFLMGTIKNASFLNDEVFCKKKALTGIHNIKSMCNLAWSITMVSAQTQVNSEQFVQMQLLWAKSDYLDLRNKYNCLVLQI